MAFLLILRQFCSPCLQIAMKKSKLKQLKSFWKFTQNPVLVVNRHCAVQKKKIVWMKMMMKRRLKKVMMMMMRLRKVRQMMHLHGSHQRKMAS